MANKIINTGFNFPNINIFNVINDNGELMHYEAIPAEGYVMYDQTENYTEIDPITGEEIPVIYYKTYAGIPKTFNFANFPYIAVLRSEVDENYIFGGGDNNHEIA